MRFLKISMLVLVAFASSSSAQSNPPTMVRNASALTVTNLQVEGKNINHVLAKIAYTYNVPINLEVATNEDLLKGKSLKVRLKKGTLADVLDNIIRQKPSYIWEASDGGIRVFPKSEFRDPLLQTLLETNISHFTVSKSIGKLNFREALTRRPELTYLLASYGVQPSNEAFHRLDIQPFGGDFSLDLENVSVRSILDSVIKNSRTKYWFINRNGENREYLLINF
jgi:hypothetical protein